MAQDFDIIDSKKGAELIFLESSVFLENHKSNSQIFKLQDGNYILFSNESRYSVIAKGMDGLNLIKRTEVFPLGLETVDFREKEQKRIKNIDYSVVSYIDDLCIKFDIDLDLRDENSLNLLGEKVNSIGRNNLTKSDIFIISLFMNETFRIKTKTFWAIKPVETINNYWIPYITDNDKKEYNVYRNLSRAVIENEAELDLIFIYRMELARFYGLRVFSKEHSHFIKTGILL